MSSRDIVLDKSSSSFILLLQLDHCSNTISLIFLLLMLLKQFQLWLNSKSRSNFEEFISILKSRVDSGSILIHLTSRFTSFAFDFACCLDYHDNLKTYSFNQTTRTKKVLRSKVQGEWARVPLLLNLKIPNSQPSNVNYISSCATATLTAFRNSVKLKLNF